MVQQVVVRDAERAPPSSAYVGRQVLEPTDSLERARPAPKKDASALAHAVPETLADVRERRRDVLPSGQADDSRNAMALWAGLQVGKPNVQLRQATGDFLFVLLCGAVDLRACVHVALRKPKHAPVCPLPAQLLGPPHVGTSSSSIVVCEISATRYIPRRVAHRTHRRLDRILINLDRRPGRALQRPLCQHELEQQGSLRNVGVDFLLEGLPKTGCVGRAEYLVDPMLSACCLCHPSEDTSPFGGRLVVWKNSAWRHPLH